MFGNLLLVNIYMICLVMILKPYFSDCRLRVLSQEVNDDISSISGTFKQKPSHVSPELMDPCTLLDIIATDSLYSTDIVTSGLNSDMKNIKAGNLSSPGEHCIRDLSTLRILSLHFLLCRNKYSII